MDGFFLCLCHYNHNVMNRFNIIFLSGIADALIIRPILSVFGLSHVTSYIRNVSICVLWTSKQYFMHDLEECL